ncbi:hypothetical protein [Sulfuracidifex tepidarius]|uniref:hypothetical protein n=1 Tax=Sulfuracidifex tepidarius TaxID=1294262 RepID=UPI0006CFEA3A|nr:hypothetical protein [Sulfuracidifex tepidarius]
MKQEAPLKGGAVNKEHIPFWYFTQLTVFAESNSLLLSNERVTSSLHNLRSTYQLHETFSSTLDLQFMEFTILS